jgi:hypothetical protein
MGMAAFTFNMVASRNLFDRRLASRTIIDIVLELKVLKYLSIRGVFVLCTSHAFVV